MGAAAPKSEGHRDQRRSRFLWCPRGAPSNRNDSCFALDAAYSGEAMFLFPRGGESRERRERESPRTAPRSHTPITTPNAIERGGGHSPITCPDHDRQGGLIILQPLKPRTPSPLLLLLLPAHADHLRSHTRTRSPHMLHVFDHKPRSAPRTCYSVAMSTPNLLYRLVYHVESGCFYDPLYAPVTTFSLGFRSAWCPSRSCRGPRTCSECMGRVEMPARGLAVPCPLGRVVG